jgi:hypothetical protein
MHVRFHQQASGNPSQAVDGLVWNKRPSTRSATPDSYKKYLLLDTLTESSVGLSVQNDECFRDYVSEKIGHTATKLSACCPFFISEVKAEIDNLLVRAAKII